MTVSCSDVNSAMRWRSSCRPLLLLLSFLTLLVGRETVSGFRICSYNVDNFNLAKASNYRLVHTLTRVVHRCDICLLQDVVDPDGKVVRTLLSAINRESHRYDNYVYQSVSSKGLGRSVGDKKKYVFIYRTETVNVADQHQYETKPPTFAREPFAVQFQSRTTVIKKFILVPVHTDPPQAVQEIDRLYNVFEKVREKWNSTNVMFLGDFHAACAHMNRSDKKKIRLFTNTNFTWLIGDKVDTTVSEDTSCAYDRIVVYGKPFLKAISPTSVKVYDFGKELKLKKSKVSDLSDHFPVEVELKSSALINSAALLLQATPLLILLSASAIVYFFL
ncbi:deoxyribonuclease gamma isoform X1 [Hippoglossus stenolepis]|uniref:deoxyribonuclease gamma isoform X1 n=1 Tax=Hippoglossus stenolepis TaxID=195615 RepID=UPI001FAFA4BE|nr:deoxyribonuclease gamma isoform X1 [Hippoglossus stenolepis]XP_035015283.2 deoxyribonuclease gamma isoform X1 [Hippoglossus stenolepis]XP_035015284.2 deoxyribonuclease gamma isoform X1 [Hippoglossus stenolepis]